MKRRLLIDPSPASVRFPPPIEFDEDPVTDIWNLDECDNVIRFTIPTSLDFLFPAAPLAFYLGAEVKFEPRARPVLELESDVYSLPSDSRFSTEIASLLRRVFYLDCLVREVGPRRLGVREFDLLNEVCLKPQQMYESKMVDRVKAYLEIPFETIESDLPDWPLATYVEPTIDNLSAIPYLVDRLSMVFPPKSSPLDRRTWVKRSLGDFYRSTSPTAAPEDPIKIKSPDGHGARVQGWLSSGKPVDAFKFLPEAFENQRDYLVESSEPISIKVVLNEDAMKFEHSKVLRVYRARAEEVSLELEILAEATREEIACAFESRCDFIHYIGHCDPSGFRCVDGNLPAEALSQSKARTFFLNACGSYSEGLELIRKGSIAGAVTFGDVIDDQAAKVGGDFARLYMYGYTIERALYHARGQAIMNRQYAIVGDGTHVLTQGETIQPNVIHANSTCGGTYLVRYEAVPVNLNGGVLLAYAGTEPNLMGNHAEIEIDHKKFRELLYQSSNDPIIYEDEFYWPEELLDELF